MIQVQFVIFLNCYKFLHFVSHGSSCVAAAVVRSDRSILGEAIFHQTHVHAPYHVFVILSHLIVVDNILNVFD
jgi:hypothetical protein